MLTLRTIISVCIVLNGAVLGIIAISLPKELPCHASQESTQVNKAILSFVIIAQCIEPAFFICFASLCLVSLSNDVDEGILTASEKEHVFASGNDVEIHSIYSETVIDKWQHRLSTTSKLVRYACCNSFGGANISEGYDDVALVFARLFHHNGFFDIVPSDIVAGFILVRYEQMTHRRQVLQALTRAVSDPSRSPATTNEGTRSIVGQKATPQERAQVRSTSGEDEESKASGSVIRTAYDEMYKQSTVPNLTKQQKRRVSFSDRQEERTIPAESPVSESENTPSTTSVGGLPIPELPEDAIGTGRKMAVLPQGILRDVITDFTDIEFDTAEEEGGVDERQYDEYIGRPRESYDREVQNQQNPVTAKVKIMVQQGQSSDSMTEIDVTLLKSIAKMSLLASYLYSVTISLPTAMPENAHATNATMEEGVQQSATSSWWPSWLCWASQEQIAKDAQARKHWTEKNCCPGCDICCDNLCYAITSGCGQQPEGGMRLFCGWWFGSKLEVHPKNRPNKADKEQGNHHGTHSSIPSKLHSWSHDSSGGEGTAPNTSSTMRSNVSPKTTSPVLLGQSMFDRARSHSIAHINVDMKELQARCDAVKASHTSTHYDESNDEESQRDYPEWNDYDIKNCQTQQRREGLIKDMSISDEHKSSETDKAAKKKSFAAENFHGINFLARDLTLISTSSELISGTELIYVSAQRQANDVLHKPYAVFVDHRDCRVIIAIRGTMSLEDAITDALCDPEEVSTSILFVARI